MIIIISFLLIGQIPYPSQPNWESIDDDFATGGALVDIDLDGYIDFITGNGNDMDQDPNRVYYNLGDSLERIASWVSSDLGYNAHITVGDINYDGYPDLAVANYGDPGAPQYDKFYYNQSGTYQSVASWHPDDLDNSFGCGFGDLDSDGDLDLAVACGESYTSQLQRAKIYLNNNGVLDTLATWQSDVQSYFYDAVWVDIDMDGDLDLALAAMHQKNLIYLNTNGNLTLYWQSASSWGTIKMAFGDVDGDGDMDMVCANNAQTGGVSNCELYLNTGTTLDSLPSWSSVQTSYYSCVALGDVDRDGDLDLAAGGWWEAVKVFENQSGSFPTTPSWSWITPIPSHLVCENISFGDVDNRALMIVLDEQHIISPAQCVFYLDNRWIDKIQRVRNSDRDLERDEYCFSYSDGWVSIKDTFSTPETLWVDYSYSLDVDLAVTNWHSSRGSFLFLNEFVGAVQEVVRKEVKNTLGIPSPNTGFFVVPANISRLTIKIFDSTGRLVCTQRKREVSLSVPGIYFAHAYDGPLLIGRQKIVVVK